MEHMTRSASTTTLAVLADHLDDTAGVLGALPADAYGRPGPGGSAIGEHVRHCLDHVRAFLAGLTNGTHLIDYEARHRGCPSERDQDQGTAMLRLAANDIRSLDSDLAEAPIDTLAIIDPEQPPVRIPSTGLREAAFLLSHGIHHNATIAHLMRAHGLSIPDGFGYAPSTLAFLAGH